MGNVMGVLLCHICHWGGAHGFHILRTSSNAIHQFHFVHHATSYRSAHTSLDNATKHSSIIDLFATVSV